MKITDSSDFSRYIIFRVCWNNHKGLCGISDNFSRQTIWDQTKTFLIHEGMWVQKISVSPKQLILSIYRRNPLIIVLFRVNSYFVCFQRITRVSVGSQIIFLDKQSETCQKNCSSKKSTALSISVEITKSYILYPIIYRLARNCM